MKKTFLLLFLSLFLISNSQEIFFFEKELSNKHNYNYREINFQNNEDNIRLSGTLITPKHDFDKVVVIVPGSGFDTRHSHYVLAEEFLKNGIAVYRFDERGFGKSEGTFYMSPSPLMSDLTFLIPILRSDKQIGMLKIGILGHSMGGIASIGAFKKEGNIDFLIQMSTLVESGGEFTKYQAKKKSSALYQFSGKSYEEVETFLDSINQIILEHKDLKKIHSEVEKVAKRHGFENYFKRLIAPDQIDFIKQNHQNTYKNINKPLLFIIGSDDIFVESEKQISLLKSFNNSNITIRCMQKLNHYLLRDNSKSLYQMDKSALNEIIKWTLKI